MNTRAGRTALIVVGAIALIIGLIFTGQGLRIIPGGFMSGSRMWLTIGVILAVGGIVLIVLGARRRGRGSTNS